MTRIDKEIIKLAAEQATEIIFESGYPYPCCDCRWLDLTNDEDINACRMGQYAGKQHCPYFEEGEDGLDE